jgi:hypothetical protein
MDNSEKVLRSVRLGCFALRDMQIRNYKRNHYRDTVDDLTILNSELRIYATNSLDLMSDRCHSSRINLPNNLEDLPAMLDTMGEQGWIVGACIYMLLKQYRTLGIAKEVMDTVAKKYETLFEKDKNNYQKKINAKVEELMEAFRANQREDEAIIVSKFGRLVQLLNGLGFEILDILEDCGKNNFQRAFDLIKGFPSMKYELSKEFSRILEKKDTVIC